MDSVAKRVSELIQELGISKNEFARKVGISSALISKITVKETNFGVDVLEKIVSAIPNLNPEWIVTGKGEMLFAKGEREKGDDRKIDHDALVDVYYVKIVYVVELTSKLTGPDDDYGSYLDTIVEHIHACRKSKRKNQIDFQALHVALQQDFSALFDEYYLLAVIPNRRKLGGFRPPGNFAALRDKMRQQGI